jgi:lactoylglutathione lyase
VAFYRDVVGLPLKFQESGYAEFVSGPVKFALYERDRLPGLIGREATPGGPAVEVVFLVEDVDAEAERLRRAGAPILSGPADRPWGHRTLHVLDPDGQVVEFAQEIPRPPR